MLKSLHIKNYAIIDELAIDFSGKLNIITGETGAGKSILMGALGLILGERADTSVLLHAGNKCIIEGCFAVNGKPAILEFLQQQELEEEPELVLRREIAANGKSRAFINDTPATLQQLKALASLLVDLHQQFDTLELGEENFQRMVVDALAQQPQLLQAYRVSFIQWQQQHRELQALQQQKNNFDKELDYFRFQLNELQEAALQVNELEALDQELQLLSQSENIKAALGKALFNLKESEQPVVPLVKQMVNQLQHYQAYHPPLASLAERLQSAQIELQDIAGEVERINEEMQFDEKRVEWLNNRLALGYKLLKKHGVQTTAALLDIQQELLHKLEAVLHIDEAIAKTAKKVDDLHRQALQQAALLTNARQKQVLPLEKQVNGLLVQVGMPNARLQVSIAPAGLQLHGQDAIEFLFDANKSNRFEPIRKVASGGELSRLMLCIKSLVAQSVDLPTLIFDEIDTGISGEAARQVGIIIKQLARSRQVICITHQPQIAGKADAHFFVYKSATGSTITTNIRLLTEEERLLAIARMLGGEKPSGAALENAKEMMGS